MSVPAFAWAMERARALKLPVSERMLLIALADRANGECYCYPGQETLAADTGLTSRRVRDLAPELERLGLIRIERRGRLLYYHILRPNGHAEHRQPFPVSEPIAEAVSAIKPPTPEASSAIKPLIPEQVSAITPEASSGMPVDTGNLWQQYRKPEPLIPEASSDKPYLREPSKRTKEEVPPTPQAGRSGLRSEGTNSRSQGSNPRATGTNLRKLGENPRAIGTSPRKSGGREIDHPRFAEFWDRYPRKVGRRTASAAFTAAVNRGNDPADIIAGLAQQPFSPDPRFQPHPTTWLRGDRWLDEVDTTDPVLRALGLTTPVMLQ